VFFQELEGWEPNDDPEEEHARHCPNCPLLILGVFTKGLARLSLRQQIRLDIGIEFARKRVTTQRQWADVTKACQTTRESLIVKLNRKRADCQYEFRDEKSNPWRDEL
jgi:hypothetical protein